MRSEQIGIQNPDMALGQCVGGRLLNMNLGVLA